MKYSTVAAGLLLGGSLFALFAAEPQAATHAAVRVNSPLTPEQALATFKLEPGLRLEVVAAEPLVVNPVAIAFDEQGRMYVAENRGYPTGPGEGKPPVGIIALLEDTKGDGHYDKRTVFAEGLTFPNGLMCWKGGVFVTCAPDVLYLKDTDGDGRADVRQVVLTGFATNSTTQLRVSHPVLGLDNWIYLTSGLVGGTITAPAFPNRAAVEVNRGDSRFRPDTLELEPNPGHAQFGQAFDDYGHRFICDNRHPVWQVVLQPRYLQRNPHLPFSETINEVSSSGEMAKVFPLSPDTTTAGYMPSLMSTPHAGTFTSACGLLIHRGLALGPEYYGNAFICEPAQNLVHREILSADGAVFASKPARAGVEFLASPDSWFRPVFCANGPDGALYICDMYRKTIEHPQYLPESMRATTDFESGKDKGRIYRIVADQPGKNLRPKLGNFAQASVKELCAQLSNPDGWWRDTARRLLLERKSPAAIPILKSQVANAKSPAPQAHFARLAALRTLEGLGALETGQIQHALADKHPAVRVQAIQLAEPRLADSPVLQTLVQSLAEDADAGVRFQCALALGNLNGSSAIATLAKLAVRDAGDHWTRTAVLSSVGRNPDEFLKAVLNQPKSGAAIPALMSDVGKMLGAALPPEKLVGLLNEIATSSQPADFAWQLAAVAGIADGLRSRGFGGGDHSALLSLVALDSPAAKQARSLVETIFHRAVGIALDGGQPLKFRLAAIGLLAHADYTVAGAPLQRLIGPQESSALQVAVVRTLGQMPDAVVGRVFVERERWRAYTPPVREAVLAALLSQPRLVPALLDALEKEDVQPWAVDPARRNQLLKHRDEAVRKRAEALFKNLQGGDRMKVYEEHKSVLALKPDGKSGHAVFVKTCAQCHVYGSEGTRVGPELTGIRNQPGEALLLHILVPDYEIQPGFTSYEVETKDGRTLSGLLAAETPGSVTLRRALGEEETVARSNIARISSTSLSLMPQELEKTMTRQELADLIGFLKGE